MSKDEQGKTAQPQVNANSSEWLTIHGRIGRLTFIWRAAVCMLGSLVARWLILVDAPVLAWVAYPAVVIFSVLFCMQAIKRAHDFGYTGWLTLLFFIPYVNFFWLLALVLVSSKPEANKYDMPKNDGVPDLQPAADREREMERMIQAMSEPAGGK